MKQARKQRIYHCKRIKKDDPSYREGFDLYREPVLKLVSVRAVGSDFLFAAGGELKSGSLIVKLPALQCDFTENDRCFVYAPLPEKSDALCKTADYRVVSVSYAQRFAEVLLERTVQNAYS